MSRPLTDTEKTIIGRDATEQRSLSAELNSRSSIVGALFGINVALVIQTDMLVALPLLQVFYTAGLAGAAFFMFWIGLGRDYGYAQSAPKWLEWGDRRIAQLVLHGFSPEIAESEISDAYWRTLATTAQINREANRYKSRLIKSAAPLSIILISCVLLARLF